MLSGSKYKFSRRRKGFSPRAGTGDYYRPYGVYHSPRVGNVQKQEVVKTTVEEEVSQDEVCVDPEKFPKTDEEQVIQSEVCEFCGRGIISKEAASKEDKVVSSLK
jgi:hypothetical protein